MQEYLAACWILEHRLEEVPARLGFAIKRPWAQALQFVLERHPSPNEIVIQLLGVADDAFHTNLRLVARSIANGMDVTQDAREEVARRLASVWVQASWEMRDRIGELIAEAFYAPLVPEVREKLTNHSLLYHGAGSIIVSIGDRNFTKEILAEILSRDIKNLYNLSKLQHAVDELGDEAIRMYLERAHDPRTQDVEQHAISVLIRHLNYPAASKSPLLGSALDDRLHLAVRLALFAKGTAPIHPSALELIERGVADEEYAVYSAAIESIWKTSNPEQMLQALLKDDRFTPKDRLRLLDHIPHDEDGQDPNILFSACRRGAPSITSET